MTLRKFIHNATEPFRTASEYVGFRRRKKKQAKEKNNQASGDGHPVLLLPGFSGNGGLTAGLRDNISDAGYNVYDLGGGRNFGLTDEMATRLSARLEEIFIANGGQKVSLIGHSLGGVYARELAREYPEMVRDVITICSPFGAGLDKKSVPATLRVIFNRLNPDSPLLNDPDLAKRAVTPPPMPTTAIFSRKDGVAHWESCINPKTEQSENIEINSSHVGAIWNKKVLEAVLDRLAQPQDGWKPYHGASNDCHAENPDWKPGPQSGNLFKK